MQPSLHPHEFRRWCATTHADYQDSEHGQPPQGAAEQLLAEHHLMTCVLVSMEHEATEVALGRELRPAYWHDAVDFIGNFVHECHRVKEELHMLPMLGHHGLIRPDFSEAIEKEHGQAKEMTLSLCRHYEEGDWEAVTRIVSMYAYLLRPHMNREERSFEMFVASDAGLDTDEELLASFHEIEDKALHGRGRAHYLAVAHRLCAGLDIAEQLKG